MKRSTLKILITIVVLVGLLALSAAYIVHGFYASMRFSSGLSLYACMDGCSIATKNQTTGMLTNSTWECWEECKRYIQEVYKIYG